MPSNEERRETAKLNLERQLQSRASADKRRRILTVVAAVATIAAAAGAIFLFVAKDEDSRITSYNVCYTKLLRYEPAGMPFFLMSICLT